MFDQMKSVPSRHMRCRITANFRATAILAFLEPIRFTSLSPPGLDLPRFYYFHRRVRSSLSGWLRSRNGKEVKELETLVDYAAFRIMISARSLDSEIKHEKTLSARNDGPRPRASPHAPIGWKISTHRQLLDDISTNHTQETECDRLHILRH